MSIETREGSNYQEHNGVLFLLNTSLRAVKLPKLVKNTVMNTSRTAPHHDPRRAGSSLCFDLLQSRKIASPVLALSIWEKWVDVSGSTPFDVGGCAAG